MAYINYLPPEEIPAEDRVDDDDNIIRIHGIHSAVTPRHMELYVQLMHRPGPLARSRREMVAVVVSNINACHY